jgi:hypothetical protein
MEWKMAREATVAVPSRSASGTNARSHVFTA